MTFASCHRQIEVPVTPVLIDMLLQPDPPNMFEATQFDASSHAALLKMGDDDYNTM